MGACQCKDKHVDSDQVIIQRKHPNKAQASSKNGEPSTEKTIVLFKSKPGTKVNSQNNEKAPENKIPNDPSPNKQPDVIMGEKSQEIIKASQENKPIASMHMDYKAKENDVKPKEIEKPVPKINEQPKEIIPERVENKEQVIQQSNIVNIKRPDRQKEKEEREKERERERERYNEGVNFLNFSMSV